MTLEQANERMLEVGKKLTIMWKMNPDEKEQDRIYQKLYSEVKEFYPDEHEFYLKVNELVIQDIKNGKPI